MNNMGYVKLYRKLLSSRTFQNEGLLKVWIWCLLKANHQEAWVSIAVGRGTTEIYVAPGQFIFGRDKAAAELRMHPSTVWKRIVKLKNLGNCDIQSNSHYSIITIINWISYQGEDKNDDNQCDNQVTAKEQPGNTNNNDNNEKNNISDEILSLRERYSDQELIDQAFRAIASTRKTNRVSDSILLSQLKKWNRYPVAQVEAGIRTYLQKDCACQGKAEPYLLGIIRNNRHSSKPKSSTPEWF